jgi:hypothetical protein
MRFEILLHGRGERLKIERDCVPGDLKIDLKVVVDGTIAKTGNRLPRNVNGSPHRSGDSFRKFTDERELQDDRALRLSILQEGSIIHAGNLLANLRCGVEHLREIDAFILHKWWQGLARREVGCVYSGSAP